MNPLPCTLTWLLVGQGTLYKVADSEAEQRPWQNRRPGNLLLNPLTGWPFPQGRSHQQHVGRTAWPGADGPGCQAALQEQLEFNSEHNLYWHG